MQMTTKPTVLIVDDAPDNLMLISMLLQGRCHVLQASNGTEAIRLAQRPPHPDLILMDVLMPELDGYETCKQLKSQVETKDIPVIFLTSRIQAEDQRRGFNVGAVDYITKPINPDVLQARVATHLQLKNMRALLLDQGLHLAQLVHERTQELLQQQLQQRLAAKFNPDNAPTVSSQRLALLVAQLAHQLQHTLHAQSLDDDEIELLQRAIYLHAAPALPFSTDAQLAPPDASSLQMLQFACEVEQASNENFDGSNPQQHRVGNQIPIACRLVRVAQVYEQLVSEHDYKPALTSDQALEVLRSQSGKHFDPEVVDAALACAPQLQAICQQSPIADSNAGD